MILTSCSSTPITPKLPIAKRPDYPSIEAYELEQLKLCHPDLIICEVYRETLEKVMLKDIMSRNYARELRSTIERNNGTGR